MTVELRDLIGDLAVHAVTTADSILSTLFALSSAGMPNGLDPGVLAVGAGAGAAAGAGAVGGTPEGTSGGSNVSRDDATRARPPTDWETSRAARHAYQESVVGQVTGGIRDIVTTAGEWSEQWGPYVPIIGIDHPQHPRNADRDPSVGAAPWT